MFAGKKTYIVAVVVGGLSVAQAMGWMTPDQFKAAMGLLAALGLGALRAGVKKGEV